MDFKTLIEQLCNAHQTMQSHAGVAVNQSLTLRNWLYGYYIVEFEQNGKDYSEYGSRLLYRLAEVLKKSGIKGISYTNLTLFRKFYLYYPHLDKPVTAFLDNNVDKKFVIRNLQTPSEDFKKWSLEPKTILQRLSFSHFVELLKVDEQIRRSFYEIECIKGSWTRMQLQRQIGSLLYERTGLSKNKEALIDQIQSGRTSFNFEDIVRDPYMVEFAGLKTKDIFKETDLEKALLDHLEEFLLELGVGFCFEGRQKSFLIDNRRFKVDLLFYHRILKCHVMIDLKTKEFTHEDAGQMNFYLNYHRDNIMQPDDNPPVGLILCTVKNETIVKYATGLLENQILVSKYMLQLPDEATLRTFLEKERKNLDIKYSVK
jgi:predicted nuclease of restriction endonuclease-like (RecB) superfamily